MSKGGTFAWRKIFKGVAVALVLMWSLGPIYWAVNSSLMHPVELLAKPPHIVPSAPTLDHYAGLLGARTGDGLAGAQTMWPQFRRATINSVVIALASTITTGVIAAFAAYAFARLRFPGRGPIFALVVATLAVPGYTVIIPLYRLMVSLNLIDTYVGLTLIYISASLPLALWIMRSFFSNLPISLEEAAAIDGAGRLYAFFKIVLPLAAPALVAMAIITFLNVWQQFSVPLLFSPTYATKPLTLMIPELASRRGLNYGLINAAGVLAIVPPMLIVVFLNRYLVQGLTAGTGK